VLICDEDHLVHPALHKDVEVNRMKRLGLDVIKQIGTMGIS